jgi:uncharacterized protein (DUF1015 family)
MAEARPFRALRYDPAAVDVAATIAPPYDVISPAQQAALYDRSPHNIVRLEYGQTLETDTSADNRYTRAAADLRTWLDAGVLVRDATPALYSYTLSFDWEGVAYERRHLFAAIRLEEWEKGVIKPHEHTLSGPKVDRLELLRATRTQISPVHCLFRDAPGTASYPLPSGDPLHDVTADGQRHVVGTITDPAAIDDLRRRFSAADLYIADGHHRYETALAYRNECRERASSWTGDEPENSALIALTHSDDPGLLVFPTHRIIHRPASDLRAALERHFGLMPLPGADAADVLAALAATPARDTAFVLHGLAADPVLVTLHDRTGVESLMPAHESAAWKRLDVNVLQYGILQPAFGIDDAALAAGGAVTYTQDAADAFAAVASRAAGHAALLNPTPVEQVLAVSDAFGRMPQKSTYFYPKLPTGLVLYPMF